ncbi:MAG: YbaN family protein [Coriobacteriia bacterium]|nr:YbaN family protein [Coriobacteriia bacterium]MBS5477292.1 YbaN family protein [Coriobacteriia bacterium]
MGKPCPKETPAPPSDALRRGNAVSRRLWAALGFATFGLGALGVALPFLPTTPFMLVAAFCFARSSERLNAWFRSTALYKRVLEGYVRSRSMTVKAKLTILVPVTALLAIGFAMMGRVPVGRVVLAVVWAAHVVYFGFVVRTDRGEASPSVRTTDPDDDPVVSVLR